MTAIGLSNGALYALIALGYTLVYGIIELINFAHGDLFMLGSVFCAIVLDEWLDQTESSPDGVAAGCSSSLIGVMALCALLNVTIEKLAYRRLRNAPKLAPLITAVGVSFILQNVGIILQRLGAELARQRAAAGVARHRQRPDPHQVPRGHRRHHPAAAADDLHRAEDEAARRCARPRRTRTRPA